MPRKRSPEKPPDYRIFLKPSVHRVRRRLPANVRHRVAKLIDNLAHDPRPDKHRELQLPEPLAEYLRDRWEVRRARLEDWRVIYGIDEQWKEIAVLAVVKRPPYDYEDLEDLLGELEDP